jgi:hypothetical protein
MENSSERGAKKMTRLILLQLSTTKNIGNYYNERQNLKLNRVEPTLDRKGT